jgi:arginase family enzyme
LLTDDGWPLVIGGDHTQALGASKGLILAETVRAVLEGRLRLSAGGNAWMMHLKNTIAQHDITAVTLQMETLVYYCITQEDLAQFLASFYVIWFDAHGDYNTEATTPSGNAHGMGAAAISGEGDPALTGILGGGAKVLPENMHFVAVRDLDREEEALMREKNVHMYPMELIHEQGLPQVMEGIIASIHRDALSKTGLPAIIHLSFDIDGIDAKYVPATGTPVGAGSTRNPALGPSLDETVEAFAGIADQVALIDVAESNFSPERDPEDITFYSVNRVLASFFAENRAQLFGEDRVQKRAR